MVQENIYRKITMINGYRTITGKNYGDDIKRGLYMLQVDDNAHT